jgi:hypothetical protein
MSSCDGRRRDDAVSVGRVVVYARADDAIRMSVRLCVRAWVCGRQTGGLGRNAERAKQRVGRDGVQVEAVTAGGGGRWRADREKQVVDDMHTVQGDVSGSGGRSVGDVVVVVVM